MKTPIVPAKPKSHGIWKSADSVSMVMLGLLSSVVFPLIGSDGNSQPPDSLLIESGGKFYLVDSARFDGALHQLEQQPCGNLSTTITITEPWPTLN